MKARRSLAKKEFSALAPRQISATVGYLGHDPELSADTVQNNVLCGSEQDAMPYLAAAALKGEVLAMENGLDTVIGSSGTRLSGGQAQRLALPGRWPIRALSSSSMTRSRPLTGTRRIRSSPTCRNMPGIRLSSSSRTACTTSRRCRRSSLWTAERPPSAPMRS